MRNVKLIDVTLRESVHVENVPLSLEASRQMVSGLSEAGIDFIEIGYVAPQGSETYLPAYSPMEYIDEMASAIHARSSSRLVLIFHPKLYKREEMLPLMTHPAVGMVRLCIPLHGVDSSLPLIAELKENGISVSANLIRASHASEAEIVTFAQKVEATGADYMYLADSNGAMLPSQVYELYSRIHDNTTIELGFHPHDNLHLAAANALEAMRAGVSIIDGSVYGFGKGAGNLCIESFVATLKRMGKAAKFDLGKLIQTSQNAYQQFIGPVDGAAYFIGEEGILTGFHNLNLDVQDHLEQMARESGISMLDLLLALENQTLVERAQIIIGSHRNAASGLSV